MMIIWIILMILSFILGGIIALTLLAKMANDGMLLIIFQDMKTVGDTILYEKYGEFTSNEDSTQFGSNPDRITEGLKTLEDLAKFLEENRTE